MLETEFGANAFKWIAGQAGVFLDYSKVGADFLFNKPEEGKASFAMNVFPGVIFFASVMQMLYHLGAMQWVVNKVAVAMVHLLGTSGAESCVGAASPLVGQGEVALLVKPFMKDMTDSEIHSIMVSGFAAIAGGILIAYISLGINGQALITSCVMSVPCGLVLSKIRYPETEQPLTKGSAVIADDEENKEANMLHAAGNGAAHGIQISLIITGVLLAFLSPCNVESMAIVFWWSSWLTRIQTESLLASCFPYYNESSLVVLLILQVSVFRLVRSLQFAQLNPRALQN